MDSMTSQLETRKNTNIKFTQKMKNFLRILYLKKMGALYYNMNKDKLVLYRYLLKIEGCEWGLSHSGK
jgi:hypothetical protein